MLVLDPGSASDLSVHLRYTRILLKLTTIVHWTGTASVCGPDALAEADGAQVLSPAAENLHLQPGYRNSSVFHFIQAAKIYF